VNLIYLPVLAVAFAIGAAVGYFKHRSPKPVMIYCSVESTDERCVRARMKAMAPEQAPQASESR
jgi:hypothetical protein